jgi:class 3 adenylate cyclase
MMPIMDGIEVIRQRRRDEIYKSLPVIFLTAKGTPEDVVKGLDAGANDYIVKPFQTVELLARVRSMMRIKEMQDSLEEWNQTLEDKVRQQLNEIERMGRIKRYLSPQIAETVLKEEGEDLFKTHRREVTVVFLDLRGFTNFSDSAEPEEVIEFLRGYHAEMGKLIFNFGGTLEHFAGDGIMVFFNDPIPREDHTEMAARMALDMQARVKELRPGWLKKGYDLHLGVGIAAGYATLGTVGFEGRMDYGAVGNVTILASRLSSEAKGGQILTNQRTLSKIDNLVEAEPLEELHLKGFLRPVAVFNIVKLRE